MAQTPSAFFAVKSVSLVDFSGGANVYGTYCGVAAKYWSYDGFTLRNTTGNSPIRIYCPRYIFFRDVWVSNSNTSGIRLLPNENATYYAAFWSISDCVVWDCLYTFSCEAQDSGSAPTTAENLEDVWFFGCKGAPESSGGTGYRLGGTSDRIAIRCCWLRSSTVDLQSENNNLSKGAIYVENCTGHGSVSGGDAMGVRASSVTSLSLSFQGNYWYITGSGTNHFVQNTVGSVATSTILASDYNVLLVNGPNAFGWFDGWSGGGALGNVGPPATGWRASGFDLHSAETSGSTHALTALGSGNGGAGASIDIDFHLTGTTGPADDAGAAVSGVYVDCDGEVRVATHDAGAHDFAANAGPACITLSPRPPTETQAMNVTVTGGTPPFTISFSWVPSNLQPASAQTNNSGVVTITVPAGATSVTVSTAGAAPVSTTVMTLSSP